MSEIEDLDRPLLGVNELASRCNHGGELLIPFPRRFEDLLGRR
jgi:hypothetical protein